MARKAEQGALQYAVANRETNPPRIGGAGFIAGVLNDFLINPRNPFNRLTAIGRWLGYFWDNGVSPLALNFADGTNTLDSRITFSRSSNATVTDSSGNIVYAPHNLLPFASQFDNSAWFKSNATVTANTTVAPSGQTTADKLAASGGAVDHLIDQNSLSISSGMVTTTSIYAKAAECTEIRVRIGSAGAFTGAPQSVTFTLSGSGSGVIEQGTPSFAITDVGNGWYRCSITATTVATGAVAVRFSPSISRNTSFNADGSGVFIWGAQLNQGFLQPFYTTTVMNLLGFSEAFDNAAWTKSNSFIQTNLLTFSEQFSNAVWTKVDTTISANTTTAPNGALTADTLLEAATTAEHQLQGFFSTTNGVTYTVSIYVKAAGRTFCRFGFTGTGFSAPTRSSFDLTTGTVAVNNGGNPTITPVGNGWYRLTVTNTATSATTATFILQTALDATTVNYLGNVNNGLFVWGAQLVQGASAGDYVQTTSAALPVMYQAPNGTMTADKLVETTVNGGHYPANASVTLVANTPVTVSCYVKQAEPDRHFSLIHESSALFGGVFPRASFNLSTGVVVTQTSGTASITAVGNGWYRCSLTATPSSSGGAIVQFRMQNNTTLSNPLAPYTGDGTSGIYIWGAQLSDSASLDTYVNNPVAAPSSTAYYGARFDYDPVTRQPRGLLIEESRANLLQQSANLSISPWSNGGTSCIVTANDGVSPDGTQTAAKLDSAANSGRFNGSAGTLANATTYTTSIFVKLISGGPNISLVVSGQQVFGGTGGDRTVVFNASTGAFVSKSSDVSSYSITNVGNSWWRVSGTFTTTASAATAMAIYAGSSSAVFYAWGGQVEVGAFPTSYIPTTTATVTRAADVAVIQGSNFSSWYKYDNGTFLGEGSSFTTQRPLVAIDDGTMSNRFQLTFGSSYTPNFATVSGGAVSADLFTSALTQSSTVKLSGAYGVNDFALSANGSAVQTDTSGALPVTLNIMRLGAYQSGTILNGYIRRINYYSRRLDNSQLQAITQ